MDDIATSSARDGTLTENGKESGGGSQKMYKIFIENSKDSFRSEIDTIARCESIDELRDVECALMKCHEKLITAIDLYLEYCNTTNPNEDNDYVAALQTELNTSNVQLKTAKTKIEDEISRLLNADVTRSSVSQKLANDEQFHRLPIRDKVYKDVACQTTPLSQMFKNRCDEERLADIHSVSLNLSKFLMKKDLVMSRLIVFDEHPESYLFWKDGFSMVKREFDVNPSEELDLLVKYLGSNSRRYAMSIRASNVGHPQRGLTRLWKRLYERYGSPELLEAALKQRLDNFQPIVPREPYRLYDLADLLSEIEQAMENDAMACVFSYFNSSSGIRPAVRKLPYGIQLDWISHAAEYKKKHRVSFPPFSVFVKYVHEVARTKNDPSLQLDIPSDSETDDHHQPSETELTLNVKKTTVCSPSTDTLNVKKITLYSPSTVMKTRQFCPLHQSKHHCLVECRTFKMLTYRKKRELMKRKGYCFACCTQGHIQRECTAGNSCTLCGNRKHHTLLHVQNHGEERTLMKECNRKTTLPADSRHNQVHSNRLNGRNHKTISNELRNASVHKTPYSRSDTVTSLPVMFDSNCYDEVHATGETIDIGKPRNEIYIGKMDTLTGYTREKTDGFRPPQSDDKAQTL